MNIIDRVLTTLTERRGFHVSQEPPGWVESLGGYDTVVGKTVSPTTALGVSAVYACVRVLAEDVASLPLILYQRLGKRGKSRASDHSLYPILHDLPNPEMTSLELRETLMGHVTTWGNAYAEVVINRGGRVAELWPLRPDRMTVKRVDGKLRYKYWLSKPDSQGRMERVFAAERIFHIRGLGFDGIQGYSPIKLHRQAIGLAMAAEEYGARFFGNGARPGMVFKHPGKLSDEAHKRLRESWEDRHGGLEKSHRIAILEEGLDIEAVGLPPEDAQFLATRKFQVVDICRIYRVPPHKVAELDRATFSNIEHQSLEYVTSTLGPWLVRWEQAIYRDLLMPSERKRYFAEHLVAGMLRGDIESRYNAYSVGRQNGWLSANDVRELENMNPIEDGGDMYLVPLNMVPADQVGNFGRQGTDPNPAPEEGGRMLTVGAAQAERARWLAGMVQRGDDDDDYARKFRSAEGRRWIAQSYRRVFLDAAERGIRREAQDVLRQAKKLIPRGRRADFEQWITDFYADYPSVLERMWSPGFLSLSEAINAAAAAEVGGAVGMTPGLDECLRYHVERSAVRHANISRVGIERILASELDESAVIEGIEELVELWVAGNRAQSFAQWEIVRTSNMMAKATWFYSGVDALEWVQLDKNPFCATLDGMRIRMGGSCRSSFFAGKGEKVTSRAERSKVLEPSWNVATPPLFLGCECQIVPSS